MSNMYPPYVLMASFTHLLLSFAHTFPTVPISMKLTRRDWSHGQGELGAPMAETLDGDLPLLWLSALLEVARLLAILVPIEQNGRFTVERI